MAWQKNHRRLQIIYNRQIDPDHLWLVQWCRGCCQTVDQFLVIKVSPRMRILKIYDLPDCQRSRKLKQKQTVAIIKNQRDIPIMLLFLLSMIIVQDQIIINSSEIDEIIIHYVNQFSSCSHSIYVIIKKLTMILKIWNLRIFLLLFHDEWSMSELENSLESFCLILTRRSQKRFTSRSWKLKINLNKTHLFFIYLIRLNSIYLILHVTYSQLEL